MIDLDSHTRLLHQVAEVAPVLVKIYRGGEGEKLCEEGSSEVSESP